MSKLLLTFEIHSWWQISSGSGDGANHDSLPVTDAQGLPYIPGKAVKGLFKHAMDVAVRAGEPNITQELLVDIFGSVLETGDDMSTRQQASGSREASDDQDDAHDAEAERVKKLGENRFSTEPGTLWFGNAVLPDDFRAWAQAAKTEDRNEVIPHLYETVASTAINANGVAKEHTLRSDLVTAPMKLTAIVEPRDSHQNPPPGDWKATLEAIAPYLRRLGRRRNRGYGRVQVTVEEENA